jgi:Sigma-70, region 4
MRGSADDHGQLADAMQAEKAVVGESDLDRRIAVRDALSGVAALPQMQRQAIFLSAVDGQTHDELASALGISNGAVRGLLYRARSTLRSAAAAITPQPLIAWASGGAGGVAPTAERAAELSAGGALGMTSVLVKGAVVAVTAGTLAIGGAVVHQRQHAVPKRTAGTSSAAVASSAGRPPSTAARALLTSATSLPRANTQAISGGGGAQTDAGLLHHGRRLAGRGARPTGRPPLQAPGASPLQQAQPEHGGSAGVAPEGRHGEAHRGLEANANLAENGHDGASSRPGDHNSEGTAGNGTQGSGAPAVGSGADGAGARGSGSDGSADGGGGPSPKGPGEPDQTIAGGDRPGGHRALAASAEPTGGRDTGGGS